MTGCSPTHPDNFLPPWVGIKLRIEGDDPLHLTSEKPQSFGYNRYKLGWDIPELVLNFVKSPRASAIIGINWGGIYPNSF